MRIAHLTQATAMGGLRRMMETLAAGQKPHHEMLVIAPTPPKRADLKPDWRQVHIKGNMDIGGHYRLFRLLARWRPDVVFLHAGSPGEMASAAALVGTMVPCVVVEHAPHFYPSRRSITDIVFPRMKRRATRWVAVSRSGARALETLWRLETNSIEVIPNGVAPPDDTPPENMIVRSTQEAPFVLGLGHPTWEKGFDVFVAAAAEASSSEQSRLQWIWVGADSPFTKDPVQVLPWNSHVGWLLRRCKVLVVPSRVEAFGLVVLEAWACGTPVVAAAVGGLSELIRHGVTGLLVENGDAQAIAMAVAELISRPELRSTLVREGSQLWKRSYSADVMISRYEELLMEILGR